MKLIKGPNPWSCLLASAAMVLDITIEDLVKDIGHNGSEIMFPGLPEPACRVGVHAQNIIDSACARGYAVTPIEARPCSAPDKWHEFEVEFPEGRFQNHLFAASGILIGLARKYHHAVAWNGFKCYDPRGRICTLEEIDMDIETFWKFDCVCNCGQIKSIS